MNRNEVMVLIEELIDESRAAILATADMERNPHIRWMTPVCLKDRPGALFMVTASQFAKVDHVRENPSAEMMLQSKALDKILTIRGKINILENPSIRTEVLECLGGRLHAFWNVNHPENELVVLELVLDEATYYVPMKGTRVTVSFV